jgi:hypothetical protein
MQRITATIPLAALLAVASATVSAECFCLSHTEGAMLRGCESYTSEKGAIPTALCTDPYTNKKSVQKINPDWKRIEAGADRCTVCRPAPRGTSAESPRGDDDTKSQQQ